MSNTAHEFIPIQWADIFIFIFIILFKKNIYFKVDFFKHLF